jgi:hypothetical protein
MSRGKDEVHVKMVCEMSGRGRMVANPCDGVRVGVEETVWKVEGVSER